MNQTPEAFQTIRELASLCATPGISQVITEIANEQITSLLNSIIKPAVQKMTATSAGLIIR